MNIITNVNLQYFKKFKSCMIKSFKSSIYGPDTSNYHQSMVSKHREDFKESMEEEIKQLESHNTWDEISMYKVQ